MDKKMEELRGATNLLYEIELGNDCEGVLTIRLDKRERQAVKIVLDFATDILEGKYVRKEELPTKEEIHDSIIVNGSYADVLYGSYYFQFKPTMTPEEFNAKRLTLLNKPDQDGVHSLRILLERGNNLLLTPFSDPEVVDFFLGKIFTECGGTTKLLFKQEFAQELQQIKYRISRKSQQIESGIRDFRERQEKK